MGPRRNKSKKYKIRGRHFSIDFLLQKGHFQLAEPVLNQKSTFRRMCLKTRKNAKSQKQHTIEPQ